MLTLFGEGLVGYDDGGGSERRLCRSVCLGLRVGMTGACVAVSIVLVGMRENHRWNYSKDWAVSVVLFQPPLLR
jgi:hypothetical protein